MTTFEGSLQKNVYIRQFIDIGSVYALISDLKSSFKIKYQSVSDQISLTLLCPTVATKNI